jgi:adenosylcobinamide-GDP ribazoletransferase
MKQQWLLFKTALMFLTRIPVGNLPFSQSNLQASARYFSWVGLLVGLIGALVFSATAFFFSIPLSILLSMLSTILLTGAFHEDGLADSCDAFGGGWTKEKILTIMKDSRLGTYGVVGLITSLSLKFLLLLELSSYLYSPVVAIAMIVAHSTSRFWAVTIMQQLPYVQDIDSSKSKPLADRVLSKKEMGVLFLGVILPIVLLYLALMPGAITIFPFSIHFNSSSFYLFPLFILVVMLPVILVRYFAGLYFKKWIGGYTGDCLGATQQICEIAFYVGCLLLWRFI